MIHLLCQEIGIAWKLVLMPVSITKDAGVVRCLSVAINTLRVYFYRIQWPVSRDFRIINRLIY